MDIRDIPAWLEGQRTTAKMQAERWQGVDPSRLLEACALVEQLLADVEALSSLQRRPGVPVGYEGPPSGADWTEPIRASEIADQARYAARIGVERIEAGQITHVSVDGIPMVLLQVARLGVGFSQDTELVEVRIVATLERVVDDLLPLVGKHALLIPR